MRMIIKRQFFALLTAMICISAYAEFTGPLLLSEDPWPPYTEGQDGAPPTGGLAVDFVQQLFGQMGIPIDMQLYPWKRCLVQMQTGERDGLMLLGFSADREEFLVYSDPVVVVKDLIWFRKDHVQSWQTFSDLRSLTFGRTAGFQYGEVFEQAVKDYSMDVEVADSDLQNFKKLAAGRIDAFISNDITASAIFKEYPSLGRSILSSDHAVKEGPLYMAISKRSEALELMPKINSVIGTMRESGQIKSIFFGQQ